jgi:hypothetical protein
MGLHSVCKRLDHHFDREFSIEVIYDKENNRTIYSGVCRECGRWRIVDSDTLKKREVIEAKLRGEVRDNLTYPEKDDLTKALHNFPKVDRYSP